MFHQPPTRLDEALLETGERPGVDSRRQHQPPRVGYQSPSQFSREYRRAFGTSPGPTIISYDRQDPLRWPEAGRCSTDARRVFRRDGATSDT